MKPENIFLLIFTAIPVFITIYSFYQFYISRKLRSFHMPKKSNETDLNSVISASVDKDIYLTGFQARKIASEIIRLVLDRYQNGESKIRNAPKETEYFVGEIIRALSKMDSNDSNEVISGLNTFRALGTSRLLDFLEEDLNRVQLRWSVDPQVIKLINLTETDMRNRLNNQKQLQVVELDKNISDKEAIFEVSY